jgi:hypothetical protein
MYDSDCYKNNFRLVCVDGAASADFSEKIKEKSALQTVYIYRMFDYWQLDFGVCGNRFN